MTDHTREWTAADTALWHTCQQAAAIRDRNWDALADVGVPFALANPDEQILAQAPFWLYRWRAIGDGSYSVSDGTFMAMGQGALTMMAAHSIGQAYGNSRRRKAAAADATPRWVCDDEGTIFPSDLGFHLATASNTFQWQWSSVSSITVAAQGMIDLQGESEHGPVSWRIHSPVAELLFLLWAFARNPRHPQLTSGAWMPPGWHQWAAAQGYPAPELVVEARRARRPEAQIEPAYTEGYIED